MMLSVYSEHNEDKQRKEVWDYDEEKKTKWVSPQDPGDESD